MKRSIPFVLTLVVLLVVSLMAGCASKKQQETTEPVTEREAAPPPPPNSVGSITFDPWSVEPGQTTDIRAEGTEGRDMVVTLEGVSGDARGVTREVRLNETSPGVYEGSLTIDTTLPPGSYRIEGTMSGGDGDSESLVVNRSLTIAEPPPKITACQMLGNELEETTRVYFDFDEDHLKPAGISYLEELAREMKNVGNDIGAVTIVGHCDERGTIEYNLALGARRAGSVRDKLAESGVDTTIRTISRGEEEPVIPNARTEEEHAKNRRAEIRVECR